MLAAKEKTNVAQIIDVATKLLLEIHSGVLVFRSVQRKIR